MVADGRFKPPSPLSLPKDHPTRREIEAAMKKQNAVRKLKAISFCLKCNSLFDGMPEFKDGDIRCPECGSGALVLSAASEVARDYKISERRKQCPNLVGGICALTGEDPAE